MYKALLKPLFFQLDAERAHHLVFDNLKRAHQVPGTAALLRGLYDFRHPTLEREVFGLRFRNPVGLAAGFDKNALLTDELAALGFGFVEIGTVTPRPQPGNPVPRLFRLPQDEALVNRMGFNNEGAAAAANRLRKRRSDIIIGGNIGKNKDTPNEQAAQDYVACVEALHEVVDYFVVNVSSPNTPNLRQLQEREPLIALLQQVQARNQSLPQPRPLLLKIAPDLTDGQLDDILLIARETQLSGLVATNTTISRDDLQTPASQVAALGAGGVSGRPLRRRATEVIRYLHQHSQGELPIIGVGGIHSPQDAQEKLVAGASLVQLYTGFIYEGPGLVKRINQTLVQA
ncbi:quinone-dependent dihydroorotate dehydrogenase [Hymenobacter taeanensis]|uniref:Dihydroorotate dehydrogenase (quinone) n=1 Tax=Hymenobacter taeanensis TaxID=2735321 RepID=A0A6M6BGR0_9BACT|nr:MULTISPECIES: quinone-dependent dihydroorotate dehydrogenase [Hymenobacter]QJX47209.1 quinone-dependent dihydroorotate dehydrogenase [Hymenobacter taeanensis]UOQ81126.1 quinone-dependent dihydroorotate dehydrogenase [Hymenobacter sp. 5414T-23]